MTRYNDIKLMLDNYMTPDNDISVHEFEFYNNHMKIMTNEELKKYINLASKNNYKPVYYTNEKIVEENIILSFSMKIKNKKEENGKFINENAVYIKSIKFPYKIDINTVLKTKFIIGKYIFIGFDISLEEYLQICRFHSNYLDGISQDERNYFFASSKEELKNIFIKYDLISKENYDLMAFDIVNYASQYFFNYDIKMPTYDPNRNSYSSPRGICHIYKVFEERIDGANYRIAFITNIDYYSSTFSVLVFNETHPDYNCIDENRMFIRSRRGNIYLDVVSTKYTLEDRWDESLKKEVKTEAIEVNFDVYNRIINDIDTILPQNQNVLTAHIFNFYYQRYKGGARQIKPNERNIKSEIDKKLIALLSAGKDIKIGDCVISKKGLKVNEDSFTMEFGKNFLDFDKTDIYSLRNALDIKNAEYNFNSIYERILQMSNLSIISRSKVKKEEYKELENIYFKVNNINIEVKKDGDRIYINDIFCRIDDWFNIINKAICYTNKDDFNRYMVDVSHIGCEYKQMIANGVSINLYNPFNNIFKNDIFGDKISIRFSLLWDLDSRTKIYLKLNNKKYLIQNKVKFKKHFNFPSLTLSINEIWTNLNECIGNIDSEMFVSILNNAIEEGKIVKKRGEELVRLTIAETFAEETDIEANGRPMTGYLVIGNKTGAKYFILKNDLDVYKFKDGQWNRRCVVDHSNKQRIYEDRLANRLINIRNEPSYISTIHN